MDKPEFLGSMFRISFGHSEFRIPNSELASALLGKMFDLSIATKNEFVALRFKPIQAEHDAIQVKAIEIHHAIENFGKRGGQHL
jgi:hypothetical protein